MYVLKYTLPVYASIPFCMSMGCIHVYLTCLYRYIIYVYIYIFIYLFIYNIHNYINIHGRYEVYVHKMLYACSTLYCV